MNPSQLCGFCQSSLKTFTSKTTSPADYTVCENKKDQCPFFTKTSLLEEYCSVLLYRVKQIYKGLPPFCKHDKPATLFLSRTKDNFNRPFFKCANNLEHNPCSYFQWADQDPNGYTIALNHTRPGYFSQNHYHHHHLHRHRQQGNSRRRRSDVLTPSNARISSKKSQRSQRTRIVRKTSHRSRPPLSCKKAISKILVHRVHPKNFKALNSC